MLISVIITVLSFVIFSLLVGWLALSDLWYGFTGIKTDFFNLISDLLFCVVITILGLAYPLYSFIQKAKGRSNEINEIKGRIAQLKRELYMVAIIVLVVFVACFFIPDIKQLAAFILPICLIIILTSGVFILLMDHYALK